MAVDVPIQTIDGRSTPFALQLQISGTWVNLTIDGSFAGRNVDEDIELDNLKRLIDEDDYVHQDILGLILKSAGDTVEGLIGVGSGNERFRVEKDRLRSALAAY
jgi:hypothetical protein